MADIPAIASSTMAALLDEICLISRGILADMASDITLNIPRGLAEFLPESRKYIPINSPLACLHSLAA
jgi:hypothetical protein